MKKALAIVLLTCVLPAAAFATSAAPSLPAEPSQQDNNKAIARRVLEEILSQGKFQVADEIYAKDFVNHGLHRNADLQVNQAAARWEKTHLPDMKITVDHGGGGRLGHGGVDATRNQQRTHRQPAGNGSENRGTRYHGVAHRGWKNP
jgi:hypothetical protein